MARYPVSRVGGVDSAGTGLPTIQNTAKGVSIVGNDDLSVGTPSIGRTLDFNFRSPNSHYPNRFTFGEKMLQSKVGNIDSLAIGISNIANTAIGMTPKGIPLNALPIPVIGTGLGFNFNSIRSSREPYFHFGKTIIAKVGGIVGSVGSPDVEQTLGIRPTGIGSPSISVPVFGRLSDFSFGQIVGYGGRFNFGGSDVVSKATLAKTERFGLAKIGNTALGVSVQSLPNGEIGNPIIAYLKDRKDLGNKTPSGAVLDFNFNQTHGISNAKNSAFYFNLYNQIVVAGINSLTIGSHKLQNATEVALVRGFDAHQTGNLKLTLHRNIIKPTGFEVYYDFGQSIIVNKSQAVKTGNLSAQAFGEHSIKLALQYLAPKGVDGTQFGKAWLSHFIRHLEAKGYDNLRLGRLWISHHTRFIRTNGIGKRERDFATNHHIGGTQTLAPVGLDATQWLTRIIPKNQTIGISKGIAGEFGTPATYNHTHYLLAKGFGNNDDSATAVRFGKLGIFNQTQTIRQYFIRESGLVPQVFDPKDPNGKSDFGKWTAIVNRNKTITAFGVNNTKFGYHQIDNKAVPVLPTSITGDIGMPMIAYRVRTFVLDGIEPPYFSYWHVIRNTAKVLKPASIDTMAFGKPSITSNLQSIKPFFSFASNDVGTPMLADRIRTVDVEWRYAIMPPIIALPTVDNLTKYITSKGFDGTDGYKRKFGRAQLIERFNIIKSHGREHAVFGQDVLIKNLTPEVWIFGHNSSEFGKTQIRTQWRKIYPFGHQMNGVGKPIIKDRKQKIIADGFNGNGFGWHFVKKGVAPPYSLQYIDFRQFDGGKERDDGFGIDIINHQVTTPSIRTNVLFAKGFNGQKIGQHQIVSNGILIDSGIFEHYVGNPKVWIKQQFITPKGINAYVGHYKMGKPQLSPYTIYAPNSENATTQAHINHPSKPYTPPMNMLIFGRVWISNQHRPIAPYAGGNKQSFGRASIINKTYVIAPKGFRGGYFGWHIIPFVPQTIEQFSQKVHQTAFGSHQIRLIGETKNQIKVGGFAGLNFGKHKIEHFHRTVYLHGFVATQMGQPKWRDTPFMWQGLRVGGRVLGNYGGFDSNAFATAWISNKIREVVATGFDGFISQSDVASFKDRLRVKKIGGLPEQQKKAQAISIPSLVAMPPPVPNIKNKAQYIRPDGNSETFRKGAW